MFKAIKKIVTRRFDIFYRQRRLRLILDVSLIAVIIGLTLAIIGLQFYRPSIDWKNGPTFDKPAIDLNTQALEADFELVKKAILPEEVVELKFNLKNPADVEINDLKLSLILQTDNFSIDKMELSISPDKSETDENNFVVQGNDILLAKLEAQGEREVLVKVYLKDKSRNSRTISWRVDGEYLLANRIINKSWALPDLTVATRPMIFAQVYYNSPQGDQLGSGPLPPQVGLPTNFWIFLNAEADSSFRDLVLSARLPKNVSWTGNSSLIAGNLNYSTDSERVIWQLNKIESEGGVYRAAFEVQLIPTIDQLNSFVNLLENIRWQAKDEISNLVVTGSLINLDTSLRDDLINRDSGQVTSFVTFEEVIQ